MSQFEFQRFVMIGQYLPTGSWVHRLDPRTRLVCGMLLLVAIAVAPRLGGVTLAFVGAAGMICLARVSLGYALRGLLPPLPFVGFLALLQVFFGPLRAAAWLDWGLLHISPGSVLAGIVLVVRFAALMLTLSLVSFSLATGELIHGLAALLRPLAALGLPTYDFVLMVQVALHFIPLLAYEAERIAKAQASRGADWGTGRGGLLRRARQMLPMLIPLFLTTLHRSETMALAMESRCYHSTMRTSLVALHFRRSDAVALAVVLGLIVAVVSL
ncbi:MAG: energy-coupling factor transporter transmembrane protein EcfT [Anaerolineae bacterium]|nr:energy-coupling factor transporter transmembrane protein EcfT [Anaerolineae bacterium]